MMNSTDRLTYLLTLYLHIYLQPQVGLIINKSCRTLLYTNVWHADKKQQLSAYIVGLNHTFGVTSLVIIVTHNRLTT